MKKKFQYILSLIFLALAAIPAKAQQDSVPSPMPLPFEEAQALVDSLTADYYPWSSISMSGKLSSPMLPVTASVRLYMERDSLVVISISAPLVGEAARIEIDNQQALIVNKLKGKYTTLETAQILSMVPGGLETLQDLLLGRVAIIGSGELSADNAWLVSIYDAAPDLWMLLPLQDIESAPFVYFYTLSKQPLAAKRFAVLSQNDAGKVNLFYTRGNRDLTIDLDASLGKTPLSATLKLNDPDASVKPISRFELSSKFKRTDLKGILK